MTKKLAMLVVLLLVVGSMVWAGSQTWTGTVSDSHCGAKHAVVSEKGAACVIRCVKHGAKYVLSQRGRSINWTRRTSSPTSRASP